MSMGGGLTLPRTNLLAYFRGGVDTIGLSVADYLSIDESLRDIFFSDSETMRSAEDTLALAWASPLLNNSDMIGNTTKGLALYASTADDDTLTKAKKYMKVLPGTFYHGINIYSEYQTWTGLPAADFYVDSVNGLDTNAGTIDAPFQTVAKLLEQGLTDGVKIGLAAGSYWREELDLDALNNTVVFGYGSGKRPTLDCADIYDTWAAVSGTTNVYSTTVTHSAYDYSYMSVWEDEARLAYVADEATCDATPGSYTVPYPCTSPATVKIHPTASSDPSSNGSVYEISVREAGIKQRPSTGSTVKNVRTKRNLHSDGSLIFGDDCVVENCLFEDGTKHNMYFNSGLCKDSIAWKNDPSSRTNQSLFVAYSDNATGKKVQFNGVMVKGSIARSGTTGIYCHTSDGTKYDSMVVSDCLLYLCNNGIGSSDVINVSVFNSKATEVKYGYQGRCDIGFFQNFFPLSTIANPIDRGVDVMASISVTIEGLRGNVITNNTGFIYASTPDLQVSNSVFYRPSFGGSTFGIRHYSSGSYKAFGNIFMNINTGHASVHASSVIDNETDNNVFYPSSMDARVSNVTYSTIDSYKAAYPALDVNSIVSDPLFTDPGSGDFSLQAGSPAIAIGAGLTNPDVEYLEIPSDETLALW